MYILYKQRINSLIFTRALGLPVGGFLVVSLALLVCNIRRILFFSIAAAISGNKRLLDGL